MRTTKKKIIKTEEGQRESTEKERGEVAAFASQKKKKNQMHGFKKRKVEATAKKIKKKLRGDLGNSRFF